MKTSIIVKQMCSGRLSGADIKAICKARGFPFKEASVPEFLENFLLSDQGINESLSKLNRDEIILLYKLSKKPGEVDVSFFDCIYGPERRNYWNNNTFNQKYSDVFKKVKNSLIRRGILFFTESKETWGKKPRLERMLFMFPSEFTGYLPPFFSDTLSPPLPGNYKKSVLRKKVMELAGTYSLKVPAEIAGKFQMHLVDNNLYIDKNRFKTGYLFEWQRKCWISALKNQHSNINMPEAGSIVDATGYALSQLKPGTWVREKELEPVLNIFCSDALLKTIYNDKDNEKKQYDIKLICELGWKWGCIAKNSINDQTCYSLSAAPDSNTPYSDCLYPDEKYGLIVDLKTIPFNLLETLNSMFDFKMVGSQLTAAPNIIRLGRIFSDLSPKPLIKWLTEKVPSFNNAVKKVESCWGKCIVHEDLLMAKVKDLGLKMTIKKSFPNSDKLLFLSDDFIAFPRSILGEIDMLTGKSGFAIKMVKAK